MKTAATLILTIVLLIPLLLVGGAAGAGACTGPGLRVAPTAPAYGPWDATQMSNAAAIVNAGAALGLSARDQTIGVMTAIGESTLRVIDFGDKAGPDSRGLFQQRDNGAWGTYECRMDPTCSATSFFKALARLSGRDAMSPSHVAHAVQRNADPEHYTKSWPLAQAIMTQLSGGVVPSPANSMSATSTATAAPLATAGSCSGDAPATASPQLVVGGWTNPIDAKAGSPFGMRFHPILHIWRMHEGTDFGAPCGTPLYAAAAGTVAWSGPRGGYGNAVILDHGQGLTTRYGHIYTPDLLVRAGDTVTAGQQIARVGSAGLSTACHLHFEVRRDGTPQDPVAFLRAQGVTVK